MKSISPKIKAFLLHKLRIRISRHPKRGEEVFPANVDPDFVDVYKQFWPLSMVPWRSLYWAWKASEYIESSGIRGDVVECGVFKGGCSILMAHAHRRPVWMYDTFTGMPEPTAHDFKGQQKSDRFDPIKRYRDAQKDGYTDWVYSSIEEVQTNIQNCGLDIGRFHLVQGMVEETIPKNMPAEISLLRLDTDFYKSTKHELEHMYPKVSAGGVVIIDDYGSWAGSRKAVDEFLGSLEQKPLFLPDNGTSNAIIVKPH